jgi:CRP-like cAMP-binding protein
VSREQASGTRVSYPWFTSIPDEARVALLRGAVERRFAATAVLYLAGAPAQHIYLVLEGRVRVVRGGSGGGRTHVLHEEGAGGSLGEVPVFEGTTYPATAIAAEPTRCLAVSRDVVLRLVREQPEVALVLLARLAGRVRLLVERLDQQTGHSTLQRLAELLLARHAAAEGGSFVLGATQQQAAEAIGSVREIVVRGLRTLRDRRIVEAVGGGRYRVLDEMALRTVARLSS